MSRLLRNRFDPPAAGRTSQRVPVAHRSPLAAHRSPLAAHRSAFTMAEVIFAIMVLGIGLILLAAAFPVGIKQNEKTQDATNAALIAQHAYDQLTKVPAAGVVPDAAWTSVPLASIVDGAVPPVPVVDKYTGRPLVMGLLDGSMTTDAGGAAWPDLRAKLVFPVPQPNPADVTNLTLADDVPQGQTLPLGHAVYDGAGNPVSFASIWGFRYEGATVYENVQWVYPADRRYYWYAFYRQMNEGTYPHPVHGSAAWTANAALTNAVKLDHITRRTYRVSVVVCKAPNQIQPPSWFVARYSPADVSTHPAAYAGQWSVAGIPPIRIPASDAGAPDFGFGASNDIVQDAVATGGSLNLLIAAGRIKRGGIMLDGWGNTFQIVDVGTNWVRLDRVLLPGATPDIRDALPLWLNPNAIAVFPTIVTKQADLP